MGWQPNIFVSYANVDTKWLKLLDPHLKGLERHARVARFDDRQLLGGGGWDAEIKAALERADIVILLVTANFIASEYIHRVELPAMLRRLQTDGCVIMPVLFETCARQLLGVEDRGYLPKNGEGAIVPINKWRKTHLDVALTQVAEHVLAQIERRRAAAAQDQQVAKTTGIDLALYRRRAFEKWSAIDLASLAAPGAVDADVTIRLGDVFVPQFARQSRPPISVPRDYLRAQGIDPDAEDARAQELAAAWERLTPVPALDLVAKAEGRRLVLLGDPGGGKSALARFILLQLLGETLADDSPLLPLGGHLPFLVELRDFVGREAEGRCADLLSYLAFCGAELGFGFDAAGLAHQLAHGPSLLIIDGLDEIFDPKRRRLMVDQIIGLAGRFPQCRVLVTSRVAGFDDHPFRAAEFAVATLVDLTPEQVERFAQDWFALVFRDDPAGAGRARDDLLETLQRRSQLRAIAGNPMILTIMATVARHRRLGRSRAALYAQALELLCYNWDYKRGLGLAADSPLVELQADDTMLMLRRIAWRMQDAPGGLRANAIAEADLRAELDAFFRDEWRFPPPRAGRAASEMLDRLQVRNWVLTLRGPGLYGFVHRTFLEYLCALELTERFKAQALGIEQVIATYVLPHRADDAWREVICLLAGALPVPAVEKLLLALCPDEAESEEFSYDLALLLAFQALAEIEPRHIPSLPVFCARWTDLLYNWFPRTRVANVDTGPEIAAIAKTIGPVAWPSPHPPARPWPQSFHEASGHGPWLTALLGQTIWGCPDAAYAYLLSLHQSRAERDDRGGLWMLANLFRDRPGVHALVRDSALNEPIPRLRAEALEALGQYFGSVGETGALLQARAVADAAPECRSATLFALAQFFYGPEVDALLRVRAVDDEAGAVRGTALNALAVHAATEPATARLLRALAVDDPAPEARRAAIMSLANYLRDDPETWPLLLDRLMNDPSGLCRENAIIWLGFYYKGRPETAGLLRSRAVEDPEPVCRREALSWASGDASAVALWRARMRDDPDADCRIAALEHLVLNLDLADAGLLLSPGLDGARPLRDPRRAIPSSVVAEAAVRLGVSEGEARRRYETLAEAMPLTLAWQRPRARSPHTKR